jgi:DNA topoisomerase-1
MEVSPLEAYCVKCKTKREIVDPQAVFTDTGTPATRGTCPVCGTNLFRMGRTEAHEGLAPPEKGAGRRARRSGKLVIVESPAKARTVGRFLGKDYTVRASVGHVRDLLRSQLSVDVENDFKPVPGAERKTPGQGLKQLARPPKKSTLYDPDKEAIAWHLMGSAEIDPKITRRVVFHRSEPALPFVCPPRAINMDLVDAQRAPGSGPPGRL